MAVGGDLAAPHLCTIPAVQGVEGVVGRASSHDLHSGSLLLPKEVHTEGVLGDKIDAAMRLPQAPKTGPKDNRPRCVPRVVTLIVNWAEHKQRVGGGTADSVLTVAQPPAGDVKYLAR